ncbi:MAG: flagellar hook-basal body complex protein FliE [Candidatus Omnitrophica bacterium]|nr:flagellar hook-basal body complex protein FliE [Candidatus Omnitrophota bacterium]
MVDPYSSMPVGPAGPAPAEQVQMGEIGPGAPQTSGDSFVDLLKKSINEVNNLQSGANDKIQKLVTGEISSIHEVIAATEEAGIAFNLLMQIRNQLMEAWNELRRMPV